MTLNNVKVKTDNFEISLVKDQLRRSFKHGEIIRPLGSLETAYAVSGLYKDSNTVQALWLESKIPLKMAWVEKALQILPISIPTLQLCLIKRRFQLWFKRMDSITVDFIIKSDGHVMETFYDMLSRPFDMWTGPLWRVCLLDTNRVDENKTNFTYVLIIAVHHCITDGKTNMIICNELLKLITSFLNGCENVSSTTYSLCSPLDNWCNTSLGLLCKELFDNIIYPTIFDFDPYFNGSLPIPSPTVYTTRVLSDKFSDKNTSLLFSLCKANKVTLNTCVITATNIALIKTCQDFTVKSTQTDYTIKAFHCVDCRRYLPKLENPALGCYISVIKLVTKHSLNQMTDFWEVAKAIQSEVIEKINKERFPLKFLNVFKYTSPIYFLNHLLSTRGLKNKTALHLLTSNMMDISEYLPRSTDDQIQVVDFLRSMSNGLCANCCLLAFHTFRGNFMISLDYYQNKMTESVAKSFFGHLCKILRNLVSEAVVK